MTLNIASIGPRLCRLWHGARRSVGTGGWLAWVALAGLCLLLFVPGCQSIPATDRDEARYAQASRQILESGDWIGIRFQDELRLKKPPGIYWLQAGLRQALGLPDTIASYRLPSLLSALLSVLLLYALSRRLFDSHAALLPPLLLAVSFLLGAEARLATTDAALLLATVAAGGVLTLRLVGRPWPADDLSLALAVAAGVLVKGPVVLVLVAGMLASAWLLRRRQPLAGILRPRSALLFLALVLPWFVLIVARHGSAFWEASLLQDIAGKAVAAQESHGQPPGFYLLTLPLAGWPWAALLPAIVWFAWREHRQPLVQALLAWVLPLWCLFELSPTKLVHYVLPTYPALVLLATLSWQRRAEWPAALRWACVALFLLGAGLIGTAGTWLAWRFGAPPLATWVFALAMLLAACAMPRRPGSVPFFLLLVGLAYAHFWGRVLPAMDQLWLSRRVAALAAVMAPGCDAPAVAAGFAEPSLVFELGTATRFADAGPPPATARCRLRIVTDAPPIDSTYAGHVSGFNYAKGRAVELGVYVESRR